MVELGNAFVILGVNKITKSVVRIKSTLFFEMEIVINIRSKYFAIRKGQIIFLFSQMLSPIFEERGKNLYLQIKVPSTHRQYLVDKGCIAVDGCSLTVCDVIEDSFAVWLIPHTLGKTNLEGRKPGDFLNLEFDLLAKYVEKLSINSMK